MLDVIRQATASRNTRVRSGDYEGSSTASYAVPEKHSALDSKGSHAKRLDYSPSNRA